MDSLEQRVRMVVAEVIDRLGVSAGEQDSGTEAQPVSPGLSWAGPGIYADVDSAVAAAKIGYQQLMAMTLESRAQIIESMRAAALENNERMARRAEEETGLGYWRHKLVKNRLAAVGTPGLEDLEPVAYTDDHGLTLVERAPYGVIASIIPSTNPTATVINNAIGMVAAGNSIVFGPHPGAKEVSCMAVSLLNEAIVAAGGPPNVITALGNPTIEAASMLMKHPDVGLLVVTGGPGVVKAAMTSGKKTIAAGPGNPPCVVDETAVIEKAGEDIVAGAGFDNNIVCICEKEVLVVDSVADRLKLEMSKHGAHELDQAQIEAVTKMVIDTPGRPGDHGAPNKSFVGKSAAHIARSVGIDVPDSTRLLLCEVTRDHPLVWTEQLMPVLPLVRVATVDEAIDLAVQCEHGFRHTAVMHSLNIAKLSKMAKVMNCSIFVKNGPCYAGLGHEAAGYASFTIASPTGEALSHARDFTRMRRCTLVDYFRIV